MSMVVLANTCEPFIRFFQRAGANECNALFQSFLQGGERAIYWANHPSTYSPPIAPASTQPSPNKPSKAPPKLVITSTPVPHFALAQTQLGLEQTRWMMPATPSPSLCQDILQESRLLKALKDWAGSAAQLDLISYATTPAFMELVAVLRQQGITVRLPESMDAHWLGLRSYLATKAGCRGVMVQVLGAQALPEGYLAPTLEDAVAIAQTFIARQQPFLVKPNDGCLGIGQTRFTSSPLPDCETVRSRLQQNPFLHNNLLVVEAFVATPTPLSPSIEVVVPRDGSPQVLFVAIQQFSKAGQYVGEVVSGHWQTEPWYKPLMEAAMAIAHRLQQMGYVGHFDLDSLVDDTQTPYFIEFNPRRTGGSHLHDLGTHLLGEAYLEQAAMLSHTGLTIPAFPSLEACLAQLQPWLYPIQGKPQGVVITHSTTLPQGKLGYVAIAPDLEAVMALNQNFIHALQL